jgi:hypothetical protein
LKLFFQKAGNLIVGDWGFPYPSLRAQRDNPFSSVITSRLRHGNPEKLSKTVGILNSFKKQIGLKI